MCICMCIDMCIDVCMDAGMVCWQIEPITADLLINESFSYKCDMRLPISASTSPSPTPSPARVHRPVNIIVLAASTRASQRCVAVWRNRGYLWYVQPYTISVSSPADQYGVAIQGRDGHEAPMGTSHCHKSTLKIVPV